MSLTPSRPQLRSHWKKLAQLAFSSFIPSAAARTSRKPSSFTAIATEWQYSQTLRPSCGAGKSHPRRHAGNILPAGGWLRQFSMWTCVFLFSSLIVAEDTLLSHRGDTGQIHLDESFFHAAFPATVPLNDGVFERELLELGYL